MSKGQWDAHGFLVYFDHDGRFRVDTCQIDLYTSNSIQYIQADGFPGAPCGSFLEAAQQLVETLTDKEE